MRNFDKVNSHEQNNRQSEFLTVTITITIRSTGTVCQLCRNRETTPYTCRSYNIYMTIFTVFLIL